MALPTRVGRSYVDPLEAFGRDFDVLSRFFNGGQGDAQRLAPYGVDIKEDGDQLIVEAELPGFKKEEVEITLENQTLTIAAQRQVQAQPQESKEGGYLLNERRYHRFLRSFTLPPTMDEKSVQARLENGVLTITINKREESKPRKISVG